ncbi:MAG: phosphoglycerate kinase [Deltaproteobacteria bacterium]|nr:phosphoglycerate kinase [Deltaproteobacteria bacterium]
MRYIDELDFAGKRAFIRTDFNVPLDDKRNITDDTRIRSVLPTIRYAMDKGAKVILASHLGRPKGKRDEKYSLAPVARRLSELLQRDVPLAPDCIGAEVESMIGAMPPGGVILLENLRFHAEEEPNSPEFAQKLARLCDVYINDAFAVSHRANASVGAITEFVKECAAGFLLKEELTYFYKAMEAPARPLVAIVGGAKVSGKLKALENILEKADKMIIGGAMANTFLKANNISVGTSLVEDDLVETAKNIMAKAAAKGVKFYLPVDCVVAEKLDAQAVIKITTVQEVPAGWMILDIGPASTAVFGEALYDAKTIIWNGPMGAFEIDAFSRGTMAMVSQVANAHALSIVGGGDTDMAVHKAGEASKISFISTGGGAFLELLEGRELPGVAALKKCGEEK